METETLNGVLTALIRKANRQRGQACERELRRGLTLAVKASADGRLHLGLRRASIYPSPAEWATVLGALPAEVRPTAEPAPARTQTRTGCWLWADWSPPPVTIGEKGA